MKHPALPDPSSPHIIGELLLFQIWAFIETAHVRLDSLGYLLKFPDRPKDIQFMTELVIDSLNVISGKLDLLTHLEFSL